MRYAEKYENHFLNIVAGRARFGEFAAYTLNALGAAGVPAPVTDLKAPLEEALVTFRTFVVERASGSGDTQTQTASENEQWQLMREFITDTDVVLLKPTYHKEKATLLTFYPQKISGLRQATKSLRISRFTAYVQALEAAADKIGAEAGQQARALLDTYQQVANTKDLAESTVADLIQELSPAAEALCWALWDVHCAALYAYRRTPGRAAALFDYALLPIKKRGSVDA